MIKVEGLDEAIAVLNKLSGGSWVNSCLYEYGRAVQAETAPYVSKPPKSKYIRTMNLSHQWYVQQGNRQVTIGNRAEYSGWVQQRATQAWFHRQHGWHTVEDRAEAKQQELVFYRAVRRKVEAMFR